MANKFALNELTNFRLFHQDHQTLIDQLYSTHRHPFGTYQLSMAKLLKARIHSPLHWNLFDKSKLILADKRPRLAAKYNNHLNKSITRSYFCSRHLNSTLQYNIHTHESEFHQDPNHVPPNLGLLLHYQHLPGYEALDLLRQKLHQKAFCLKDHPPIDLHPNENDTIHLSSSSEFWLSKEEANAITHDLLESKDLNQITLQAQFVLNHYPKFTNTVQPFYAIAVTLLEHLTFVNQEGSLPSNLEKLRLLINGLIPLSVHYATTSFWCDILQIIKYKWMGIHLIRLVENYLELEALFPSKTNLYILYQKHINILIFSCFKAQISGGYMRQTSNWVTKLVGLIPSPRITRLLLMALSVTSVLTPAVGIITGLPYIGTRKLHIPANSFDLLNVYAQIGMVDAIRDQWKTIPTSGTDMHLCKYLLLGIELYTCFPKFGSPDTSAQEMIDLFISQLTVRLIRRMHFCLLQTIEVLAYSCQSQRADKLARLFYLRWPDRIHLVIKSIAIMYAMQNNESEMKRWISLERTPQPMNDADDLQAQNCGYLTVEDESRARILSLNCELLLMAIRGQVDELIDRIQVEFLDHDEDSPTIKQLSHHIAHLIEYCLRKNTQLNVKTFYNVRLKMIDAIGDLSSSSMSLIRIFLWRGEFEEAIRALFSPYIRNIHISRLMGFLITWFVSNDLVEEAKKLSKLYMSMPPNSEDITKEVPFRHVYDFVYFFTSCQEKKCPQIVHILWPLFRNMSWIRNPNIIEMLVKLALNDINDTLFLFEVWNLADMNATRECMINRHFPYFNSRSGQMLINNPKELLLPYLKETIAFFESRGQSHLKDRILEITEGWDNQWFIPKVNNDRFIRQWQPPEIYVKGKQLFVNPQEEWLNGPQFDYEDLKLVWNVLPNTKRKSI